MNRKAVAGSTGAIAVLAMAVLITKPWESASVPGDSSPDDGEEISFGDRDYGELNESTEDLLAQARSLEGTPFQSGGNDPSDGFNTSGFVQFVYHESSGIRMPRIAGHQYDLGQHVSLYDLHPGDLVFFEGETLMSGIYIGHGEFMTVSQSNGVETLSFETDTFWSDRFIGGRRLSSEEKTALHPSTYSDHDHPAVRHAIQYLDTPYVFGGNSVEGFDCSFFVQQVFRESMDVYLPRVTRDQFRVGSTVSEAHPEPGDVLYFSGIEAESDADEEGAEDPVTHAGIYLGGNFMIHASRTEEMTQISYMNDYWQDAFTGIKRFDELSLGGEYPVVQAAAGYLFRDDFTTSGFVSRVFSDSNGTELPSTANAQFESGTPVEREDLEIGDLVFFEGEESYLSGLYIGHSQFMISSVSSGVTTRHLDYAPYFSERYAGARRY
ncbi:C40 family peptidase [Alteribacter natronophilus]|uniref:C40 family peptidase n=1 Tax=Alteribacter natronophilus TaxID=2583810 RepID=UPI00110F04E7|nr:NlpC/P60 family protein [Alteribacter natronophilus]TMW73285.1 hypothetical protein FGB90_02940 [Alteribacter natronophilus]